MGLLRRVAYRRNDKLFAATLLALLLAVVNYYFFFDVLAPNIGNTSGSVKANMGVLFVAPVLVLTAIQALYAAGVLHLVTRSFFFEKRDFLKALFISSCVVLLYSAYYTLVPTWGPYTFLTGSFRGVPATTYAELAIWTALLLTATSLLIWKLYDFKRGEVRRTMVVLVSGSLLILVMAFATG